MPAVKIGPKHQITIPKEVFSSLNLEVGDFLDTRVQDNTLVLIPKKTGGQRPGMVLVQGMAGARKRGG